MQTATMTPRKWQEALVFFILAVLFWPIVVTMFVAAYGFSFWMYFVIYGPPAWQ
jgi:nitrate reductase NapE component